MKVNIKKVTVAITVAILIVFVPVGVAAPVGTSESTVVETAKSWIGVKEKHGGNDRLGIDCSHLVYQVYKQAGTKNITFETVPNMKKNKYFVTMTSPKPGDVIFWKKNVFKKGKKYSLVKHVGIYIGDGQFIHTNNIVTIDNVSGIYKEGVPYYSRWDNTDNEISIKPKKQIYLPFWEKNALCLLTHKQTTKLLFYNP